MLTVACVMKSGGEYTPYHVKALAASVRKHLTRRHRFVCLTDIPKKMPANVMPIELPDDWPGWWSKICLFKKGLIEGPVFYMDLDTIPVRNIDDLVLGHRFTVLRNFWTTTGLIGSGLMAWNYDLSPIYHAFKLDPQQFIDTYKTRERWGDQGFIFHHTPIKYEMWQRLHPDRIVSWKLGCHAGQVPKSASIVCFHGVPRPWNTPLWSVAEEAMNALEQA